MPDDVASPAVLTVPGAGPRPSTSAGTGPSTGPGTRTSTRVTRGGALRLLLQGGKLRLQIIIFAFQLIALRSQCRRFFYRRPRLGS